MHSTNHPNTSIGGISRERIAMLRETEAEVFRKARPKSLAKAGNGLPGFFGGVPMHWMNDWPTPFPILVDSAKGATITDIDGNKLDDFCLGDTGSMFGHSPPPVARPGGGWRGRPAAANGRTSSRCRRGRNRRAGCRRCR